MTLDELVEQYADDYGEFQDIDLIIRVKDIRYQVANAVFDEKSGTIVLTAFIPDIPRRDNIPEALK